MSLKNIKFIVQYNGTCFHGWQKQPEVSTVQGELEKACEKIFRSPCTIQGASRTDSGVHALGQTANFQIETDVETERIPKALNSLTPEDITVTEIEEVESDFNSRFSARGKIYHYLIHNSPHPHPAFRNNILHITKQLDMEAMNQAAKDIAGEKDYCSFGNQIEEDENTFCNIEHVRINEFSCPLFETNEGKFLRIEVKGDRFLYKMVRTIAGTLVEVGQGKLLPEKIHDIINSRNRANAGPTLKPHGLYLVKVLY